MANKVEIVIHVENAQGLTALTATNQALKQVGVAGEASMAQLGASAQGIEPKLQQVGQATRQMGGHFASSLDGVRLMSQEFGFRLPRALESMMSRMPAVTAAVGGLMSAFAGIAVVEVLYRAGDAVYNLYEKYISLNAAAEAYQATVQKHRDEDFVNTHSIEVTVQRLNEATEAAKNFKAMSEQLNETGKRDIQKGSFNPYLLAKGATEMYDARQLANKGYVSQEQADALRLRAMDDEHAKRLRAIDDLHAEDAALLGRQKITAETNKKLAVNAEDRTYNQQRDSVLQKYGLARGGQDEQTTKDSIVRKEGAAQEAILARETRDRTIALQNEATDAGLRDSALLRQQTLQAEDAIRRSKIGTQAQIEAIEQKYFNDQSKRIAELTDATKKLAAESARAGLGGVPAIASELTEKLREIEESRKKMTTGANLRPDQLQAVNDNFDSQRNSANQDAMGKRRKMDEDYTDFVDGEVASRTEAEMSGLGKIEAARIAQRQKAQQTYAKDYTGKNANGDDVDLGSDKNHANLARQNSAIDKVAASDRDKLAQQLRQQTLQMDTELAQAERRVRGVGIAGWVQDYRGGIAEIQSAETTMLAKIADEQRKTGSSAQTDDLFNRQKVDAVQKADAQIQQLNQQMAHQVASTLQGAFDDPVHYIQNKMKQMMFEILANWIIQSTAFKSTFGSLMGGLHPALAKSGAAGPGATGLGAAGMGAAIQAIGGGPTPSTSAPASSLAPLSSSGAGTVGQAMVAPGYSGTASMGGGLSTSLSTAGDLAGMGIDLAGALNTHNSAAAAAGDTPFDAGMSDSQSTMNPLSASSTTAGGALSTIGSLAGAGMGAYTGTMGIIGAYKSGSASGVLNGALSGAELGASIGMLAGPLGAAIGAGIGAVGGAAAGLVGMMSGEGGRIAAAKYFKDNTRPAMIQIEDQYKQGGGDALSAIAQIDDTAYKSFNAMQQQFGSQAAIWVKGNYLDKERIYLEQEINGLALGGRDYTSHSMVEFHDGGMIGGFGDFATSGNEGLIHAMMGEVVMNRAAASAHAPMLGAMNAGASPAEIAGQYLRSTGGNAGSGGTNHYHTYEAPQIHALDGADVHHWLNYRGGADAIAQAQNKRSSRYAGDAN